MNDLKFIKQNYGHLDIDFLPDRLLKEAYENNQLHSLTIKGVELPNLSLSNLTVPFEPTIFQTLSTQTICDNTIYHHNSINFLLHNQEIYHFFSFHSITHFLSNQL